MNSLDIITRAILIPLVFIYIFTFFKEEAIKDIREWRKLFSSKKKTAQTCTVPPVIYLGRFLHQLNK